MSTIHCRETQFRAERIHSSHFSLFVTLALNFALSIMHCELLLYKKNADVYNPSQRVFKVGSKVDSYNFQERFIQARRTAIGLDFAHLNSIQREAVLTTKGPLLLLAGAGSGKTTVLMQRIANLLKYGSGSDSNYLPEHVTPEDLAFLEGYIEKRLRSQNLGIPDSLTDEDLALAHGLCAVEPVEPWRVIAITFTNKAAGEMKSRLEKILDSGSEDIWAMTFHSACARILRRDIEKLGYERSYTIYDTTDSISLLKRILKDMGIEERSLPSKTVLGYISRAKDAMISAEEFLSEAEKSFDSRQKLIGRAYLEYSNRLKSSNSLDFDDLLLLTIRLFRENPDVLSYYQEKFKYVLVDEYQDTNNLQYLLVSALADRHRNICVVGDDDQSIYKFRGATIENILSFEKRYEEARVIRLEQNYRSTSVILAAANEVIRNNKGRKGKKLWTENEHGEKPSLYVVEDERGEAQLVADIITSAVSSGLNFRDHAILYRMNAQSNQFETAFKRIGIPYRIFGGTGFFDRAEIKDMLAYLCVIQNPYDDVRLLRIINNPPRGIGNTTLERVSEIASENNTPLFEIIKEANKFDALKSSAARLIQFADLVDDLREMSISSPLDELYNALIERTGYIRVLLEKSTFENQTRAENVLELQTSISSFMNENGGSLFDFLSETALITDLDRYDDDADNSDQSSDRVLMMTMHSAKGLEFDTVFIAGAEEGLFPGARSIGDPIEMEEERRLCYVAMTRAMRRLHFLCAKQRMLFGKTYSALPSRFVREIDDTNIEIHDSSGGLSSLGVGYRGGLFQNWSFENPKRDYRNGPRVSEYSFTPVSPTSQISSSQPHPHPSPHLDKETPVPTFSKGDAINHKAFGQGVIIDIKRGGGDALLEIAFQESGTKRMMLKAAARYMSKTT